MECKYGCGRPAKHQSKNGVWCCEPHRTKCPAIKQKTAWNRGGNRPFSKEHRAALSAAAQNNPKVKRAASAGGRATAKKRKIPLRKILVKGSSYASSRLKKRLIAKGLLEEQCSECGLGSEWNGRPLVLQLDHINGVRDDHRLGNLRILCPNCHTQTPTYVSRNRTNPNRTPGHYVRKQQRRPV